MRLFLAVDVDPAVRREVGRIAAALREEFDRNDRGLARDVKWTDPGLMHITLHFFGEVAADVARALREAIAGPWPASPFSVGVAGLGVFPPSGTARVLWIGVREGARELAALHTLAADRLDALPVALDRRPFSAHLTLGRFRQPTRRDVRPLLSAVGEAVAGSSVISGVTLYSSRLSARGPTYEVEARGALTA